MFCTDFALSISRGFFSVAGTEFSQLFHLFHCYLAPEENNASLLHLPASAIPVRDG